MTHTSESYKQNLQHFEAPNEENDQFWKRTPAELRETHNKLVSRANQAYAWARKNGVPEWFKEYEAECKKCWRSNAPVNFEAVYGLRSAFGQTIYDNDISAQIGVPSFAMDKVRWYMKDYTLKSFEWPRLSRAFRNPAFLNIGESSEFDNGIGMYLGLSFSFSELAESTGGLWSPQAVAQSQLGQKFGLTKSRRFFLGSSYYGALQDDGEDGADLGITGLFNATGIQTGNTGVGDNIITTAHDFSTGLSTLLALFDKVYVPHEKVLITTRGVFDEMLRDATRDTYTGVTQFERVLQKYFDTGQISRWIITDQLKVPASGTVPAVAEQQAIIVGVGQDTLGEALVYPTQTLPLDNKLYASDFAEVTIFGNIIKYWKADTTNNAFPAAKNSGDMTTTSTGAWLRQGTVDLGRIRASLRSANA